MSDDLTNDQIALLCDIGEFKHLDLTVERKRGLEHLISIGYVIPSESLPGRPTCSRQKPTSFLACAAQR